MAEPIISAIAPNIFERCVGTTGEHLGYIWSYKKNMADLEMQVKKLEEERGDKSHSVTVAEKNTQKIKNRVKSWQDEADKISKEATEIIDDHKAKGKNRCLMGLCPNLVSRYRFSKRACEKGAEIKEAMTEAEQIKKVSDPAIGLGKEIALSTEGVFTFKSRESVLEDIMKTLQDETKNLIGVFGFGGMGKTTLAKQVAARADEEKMFEEIVFAPVTQTVELKKIQEKIASMLDLKLKDSTEAESAGLIYERLKGKKVLVVLDDLWKELDLHNVGIPFGAEHMGCKILLTSRNSTVLSLMGTKIVFQLGALEEEEAWRLFEEKTIDVVKDPAFLAIGKKVAKRCAGLPVLIVTVAASLSRRPKLPAWHDALKQLRKMDNKQIHEIVNSAMKTISYNHLEQRHKQLFLLCGILGGDASIEHLLQYSLGWNMFDGEAVTVGEARNRLHAWIFDLKESCLLLDGDSQRDRNSIKMHDVVRDVAISIAEKDLNMFSVEDDSAELNIWHRDSALKRCTAVVFRACPNLSGLPQQLECPLLELCILSRLSGTSSLTIPNSFFEKTINLKVLDMSQLYFSALPSSLSFLKNLQTFRADNCYSLKNISIIKELKKLQTLSFSGSNIEELPSGLGQLSELRLLDLSNCSELKVILAGLIAGLSRLEELYMRGGFDRWDVYNSSGKSNASLVELKHLPYLSNVEIAVPNAKLLSNDLNFEKWEKCDIIVGDMWDSWSVRYWLDELEITRKVCLQLGTTSINHLQYGVKRLFKITECLCLGELKGVKNVTPELDEDGFPDMKHFRIKRDYEIQYIVNLEEKRHRAFFPALESLHLNHMLNLQTICNGQLMEGSFYNLKIVKVKNCNRLENLLSFSMAIGLGCLQEIQVSKCNVLEEIVAKKNREDDGIDNRDGVQEKIQFAQLRKLSLKGLPKLNNFYNGKMFSIQKKRQGSLTTDVETEDIISEEAEFKSPMPFFKKVSFIKLEELELSEISNLTQIWSHKLQEMPCCNLTQLTVENCDDLKYLFTPSISTVLVVLQRLTIQNCAKMKQIVAKEEGETKIEKICFPQLSYVCLGNLPNLTTFYSSSVQEMDPKENLDNTIHTLFNEEVSFPKMETLEVSKISNLTEIWNRQVKEMPCCSLTTLEVENCDNLKYLLTPSITTGLAGLQQLTIRSCAKMKQVVSKKEWESKMETISFPQLSHLCLQNLSNLTAFYWGIEEMDANDNLEAAVQPFFSEKVKLPSLKKLNIGNLDGVKILWPQNLRKDSPEVLSFQSLQQVEVYCCQSLEHVFPASVAQALNKLEELSIRDCGVETIISDDKDIEEIKEAEGTTTFTFPKLVKFNLRRLSKFKCFYPRGHTTEWPALEKLQMYDCDKIQPSMFPLLSVEKVAFSSSTSSKNLLEMEINNCVGLKYLFTPSIAKGLEKVQKLSITNCSLMKAIVGIEGREAACSDMIVFPQLIHLQLKDLPNLARFYSRVEEMDSDEKLDSEALPLFNQKVQFPRLEELSITRLDSINTLWLNQQLNQVKEVTVTNSATRNQINLKEDSHDIFSFQNVQKVTIRECKSLKCIFPVSMAQSFNKLEGLRIENCEVMDTVVGDENHMATSEKLGKETEPVATTFMFPKLVSLYLKKLPRVECFYPREHAIEWPTLKVLDVCDCDKVSAFDFLNISEKQGDIQFEKVISNLEFLSIRSRDMIKIMRLYDHFSLHIFHGLRRLSLTEFHGEAVAFPSEFLNAIHNQLQTIQLYNCSFREIFPYEGEVTDHTNGDVLLPQLRAVELKNLPELKCICKKDQHSTFIPVLDKLTRLYVDKCPCLTNLVPSSVSFRSLKYLTISNCGGLANLTHPSTARSLEQLRMLSISECEMIEEIIGGEGREDDHELSYCYDGIIFNKLWYLSLDKLPRLTGFCSSHNYTFNFPKLDTMYVIECPNIKTFCGGITTTPKLRGVRNGNKNCWEGDINTTIQQSFAKTETERLNATFPSKNHIDVDAQAHESSAKELTEPIMEGRNATDKEKVGDIREKGTAKEVEIAEQSVEHFEKSEEMPCYRDPSCSNCTAQEQSVAGFLTFQHGVASSSAQLSPQINNHPDKVRASPLASQVEVQALDTTISTISSTNQFEGGAQIHDKCPEKSTVELEKECQIRRNGIEDLGEGVGTSTDASNSQVNDFIPLLSEFLRTLQTQPVDSINAEQVQFMEHAMEWLGPYLHKSRECVERNKAISELKLEIAEREAQLRALKEKQKALEDENKATASSIPRFG